MNERRIPVYEQPFKVRLFYKAHKNHTLVHVDKLHPLSKDLNLYKCTCGVVAFVKDFK